MSFFRSAFQSTLLRHEGEAFFLRNADFFNSKMPQNSLEEKFCSWEFYTESE